MKKCFLVWIEHEMLLWKVCSTLFSVSSNMISFSRYESLAHFLLGCSYFPFVIFLWTLHKKTRLYQRFIVNIVLWFYIILLTLTFFGLAEFVVSFLVKFINLFFWASGYLVRIRMTLPTLRFWWILPYFLLEVLLPLPFF